MNVAKSKSAVMNSANRYNIGFMIKD
jgi:hypothetical protein